MTQSGSVKIDGSRALRPVSVSAGQITSEVLRVDTAVNVTVNSTRCCATPLTKFVLPTGLTATLSSPDRTAPTRVDYPAKTVVGGVDMTWPVFPAPAGYDAYLGPCQGAKHVDTEPGTTPPKALLPLSTVTVQLTGGNASGGIAANRSVKAHWRGAGASTCSETLTFATSTDPACKPNANGTDGCWLYVAVPAGTWRLELDGYPGYFVQGVVAESTSYSVQIGVP